MLLALSFPVAFAILRGNNDIYLYLLVLAYGALLLQGKCEVAAALIGAASAFEPITLLLGIPILLRTRIREYALLAAGALAGWLSPLAVGPHDLGQYWQVARQGLANYTLDMAEGDGGVLFGNSLWSLTKIVIWNLAGVSSIQEGLDAGATWLPYYRLASGLLVVILVWIAYRHRHAPTVVLLALTIGLVLVPDVSATYKMTTVFGALLLYIYRTRAPDLRVVLLLAFALAPKTFYSSTLESGGTFTLDSLMNPLLLMAALVFLGLAPGVRAPSDAPGPGRPRALGLKG